MILKTAMPGAITRTSDCWRRLPAVRGALTEIDHAVQQLRERKMLTDLTLEAALRVLDLVDRYHATAYAPAGA